MIAKLRGIIDSVGEDWVILDVQGVGYQLSCSGQTLARLDKLRIFTASSSGRNWTGSVR
jgi:Holliday junction resolvasome RuvABC DNA-binding subunit